MSLIRSSVAQPITVAVGVILALLAGVISIVGVPVQMTPEVESVVISITTTWEGASAQEIETDVVEAQEERLGNLEGLVQMSSTSSAGQGQIRLEFATGTDIAGARTEVDLKLAEVPGYPEGVNKPVVIDADPESVDYISWVGLASKDPDFDATKLQDFVDRRVKPRLERIPGVAEVGFLGARERELRIIADPARMANLGVTYAGLVSALREENGNFSGGRLPEGKNDIRVRAVGRFDEAREVEELVLRDGGEGRILLRDVADVEVGYKERTDWVRSRGILMPYFNFQLESGANLLETMAGIDAELEALMEPGGLLELEAERLGVEGGFELVKSYDATSYVRDAIALVRSNILIGGAIATLVLLLFLRSLKSVGIVALAIPISIVTGVVVFVALGRTVNIVSLAGMAFAVGMVVDNAIVVIENIFRHLEMGKTPQEAAVDGATEVGGAVLASTLTTVVVFIPILLIEDAAGQLFRDIALAIVASVAVSLVVSLTLIPSAAGLLLRAGTKGAGAADEEGGAAAAKIAGGVAWLGRNPFRRIGVIVSFAVATILGIWALAPPLDYLPAGNRNIAFGIVFPPPAYNLGQLEEIGERVDERMQPFYRDAPARFAQEALVEGEAAPRYAIPLRGPDGKPAGEITPPALSDYFIVGLGGQMFVGAISQDAEKAPDVVDLLNHALGPDVAPDVFAFALQFPLFQQAGSGNSAISIDMTGRELDDIVPSGLALMGALFPLVKSVQPDPGNFMLPSPELRFLPLDERLREAGLSRRDLGLAVQANADGIIVPRQFEVDGELKDLKILSPGSVSGDPIPALMDAQMATPDGRVVDVASVARVERVTGPDRIKRVDRQRAISLEVEPREGMPLEEAIALIDAKIAELREQGAISPAVDIRYAGSVGKLAQIKEALAGDGTFVGTLSSSLFLALTIVYLLMVVLFQSFLYPLVILVSVPLATFGGFIGLAIVHGWSLSSRYVPVQNLDVLTILGFVILAGVVVNNAILIVHQALHFVRRDGMEIGAGVQRAVRTRVRPIAMGTLTSVGGMLPLVLAPGSGSELYRGLGAVVVGGLIVSTVFTLVLVPLLLGGLMRAREAARS